MRCVVTGGAGFIGSHLVDHLLGLGHQVVVVDNYSTGQRENLEHLEPGEIEFLERDLVHGLEVEGAVDRVYNLASPASPKDFGTIPIEILRVGSDGTRHALELSEAKGARFLQASTSEVYGDPLVHPQTEDYFGNVNPIGERAVYDEAKRYAEALIASYHRQGRVETRIARIFNTYGPRMRLDDGRVLPNFACQALEGRPLTVYGDGSQTRSFCYVTDLVRGLVALMEGDHPGPINLGRPDEVTVLEFATRVKQLLESDSAIEAVPMLHVDDPKQRRPDITRAKEVLGWQPEVTLEEGLEVTLEDFRRRVEGS